VSGWSIYIAAQSGYFGGLYAVGPGATSGGLVWTSSGYNNGPSGVAADGTYVYGAFPGDAERMPRAGGAFQTIAGTQGVGITDVATTQNSLFFITTGGHVFRLAR
jgi:hypothetical protein